MNFWNCSLKLFPKKYFERCFDFLERNHGSKNVVYVTSALNILFEKANYIHCINNIYIYNRISEDGFFTFNYDSKYSPLNHNNKLSKHPSSYKICKKPFLQDYKIWNQSSKPANLVFKSKKSSGSGRWLI